VPWSRKPLVTGAAACSLLLYVLPAQLRPGNFPTDDAYFYLQVADHIQAGHGSTFIAITLTNGYHPLWMAFCVAVLRLGGGDRDRVLHAVLGLQQFSFLLIVWLFYRLARGLGLRSWFVAVPILAFGFLATAMYAVEAFVNGLTVVASLYFLAAAQREPRDRNWTLLGFALGSSFLARLDNIFLVASLAGGGTAAAGPSGRQRLRRLLLTLSPLALLALPYLVSNQLLFGHLLPISGRIKTRFPHAGLHFDTLGAIGVVVGSAALVALAYTWCRPVDTRVRLTLRATAAGVLLHGIYVLLFVHDNTLTWSYVPGIVHLALFVAVIAGDLRAALVRWRWAHHMPGLALGATLALLALGSLRAWVDFWNPDAAGLNLLQFRRAARTKWQNDVTPAREPGRGPPRGLSTPSLAGGPFSFTADTS